MTSRTIKENGFWQDKHRLKFPSAQVEHGELHTTHEGPHSL